VAGVTDIGFRVLGPSEVIAGDRVVDVGGPRLRTALALLVAEAGHVVSVAALVDGLWGRLTPPDAERTVRTYMSRLRKALAPAEPISTRHSGYVLTADPDAIDAVRFERLAEAGHRALRASAPEVASERLVSALALWRGVAYGEFGGTPALETERVRLDQMRWKAIQHRIDADLAAGLGQELVAELVELTTAHPGHERLWGQLMTALYRSGRQADALDAFRRARQALAEATGLEPTPALLEIHRQLLAQDPRLLAARPAGSGAARHEVPWPRPAQLPSAVPAFTGRESELAVLDGLLEAAPSPTVVVSAVSGTAGVGKTALAVHWARQARESFPDGQLYVNLHGFDPGGSRVNPAEAIRGFLDALGIPPARIPPGLQAQTSLYRSLLTGRRVLVVLDNARDAEQVRPLLPGAPGCMAIVTSRNQLTSLAAAEGANVLTVDLLGAVEARELLTGRLGRRRIAAEPDAVAEITARCAGLPLALAIVAARAAAQPHLPLAVLAEHLRGEGSRLDILDGGDPTSQVRAVFSWSYHALGEQAARLFRLMGLHPGPDAALPALASLPGVALADVRGPVGELVRWNLLTEHAPGRYTLHDLLRTYARELAATVENADARQSATHRMFDHYLHTARAADAVLTPQPHPIALPPARPGTALDHPADHRQAQAWFTAEHRVLLTLVDQAPAAGFDAHAWQLAATLTTFLDRHGLWRALADAHTIALAAARRQADKTGRATAYRGFGLAHDRLGHRDTAHRHYLYALEEFDALGDHVGQARTHQHLARMSGDQRDYRSARDHAQHSLDHYAAIDDPAGQSAALNHLGWFRAQVGDHLQALTHCRQALILARRIGDLNGQAHIWDSLGYIRHRLGEHQPAIDCYRHALELFHQTGDRHSQANALASMADIELAAGRPDAARAAWARALALIDALGLPDTDPLRAEIHRHQEVADQRSADCRRIVDEPCDCGSRRP